MSFKIQKKIFVLTSPRVYNFKRLPKIAHFLWRHIKGRKKIRINQHEKTQKVSLSVKLLQASKSAHPGQRGEKARPAVTKEESEGQVEVNKRKKESGKERER